MRQLILLLMIAWSAQAAPGDEIYSKPGQLVDAGDGARLNLYCTGSGSPAVILESGFEDWAPAWATVQPRIAKFARVCSYDRAGTGFSEPGPLPRTCVRIAEELRTALHNAGVAGPYLLVGHSFGGDCVRTFASRYVQDVAGLVLVEADPADVEPPELQAQEHRDQAGFFPRFRECRDAVAQHKPLPPLKNGKPCTQQFFRGLPEPMWSPELNASLLQLTRTKVALYDACYSEFEQFAADEAFLQQHPPALGSRPVRVLSTRNHGVHFLPATPDPDPKNAEYQETIVRAQAKWLSYSTNSRQIFTKHSAEYVQFDEPDAVVDAIRDAATASGK
jgi:pimeloyl-ACP methyl ester carboxylesterase